MTESQTLLPPDEFIISRLGDCTHPSPMRGMAFTPDNDGVLYHTLKTEIQPYQEQGLDLPAFEMAGPRETIFFDPDILSCGIVTCGGLCPGLNDVIRAIVLSLYHHYGVRKVFGFRYGFEGLNPSYYHTPLDLTPTLVGGIHQKGGSVLGSSRGPQDPKIMVDTLVHLGIGLLFVIGGDGTLRGAEAIAREIERRDLRIGVISIPKTIDNDICNVDISFGYETAVAESRRSTSTAHVEAIGARNGIGLVKLMGRESGFIAAAATLANNEVNFCLIPEVPFSLDVFLKALEKRLRLRGHAVIVVGEGAGQSLFDDNLGADASGNRKLGDIGHLLKDRIKSYFQAQAMDISLKYIDPSYMIRSTAASASDSAFCLQLGQYAVHAGMSGRTNMLVGHWNNQFTHVPIPMAVQSRKKVDPQGKLWASVLASTGQPINML
ncbi:ATP-dependent 6-phosphofructokinase [Desulfopila aestuarii]|uniref:ATP-dependent 6-phosphofructokinase n=1 Tax=Desulfopila aestuarii DSM 18488 TaxID=1121416 RepID=A0A1M7Y8Z7_9BACT|nr:ATP-dependent 6-phosphofructokinase [Desulfopila aestuarii]SHO49079.1 6-phosphofructokinase [Desulfopila aestuarii DSM 18488]